MIYKITVGTKVSKLHPRLYGKLRQLVCDRTKFRVENYRHTQTYKRSLQQKWEWDGYKQLFKHGCIAPAGLYRRIANVLRKEGHEVKIKFENDYPAMGDGKLNWKHEPDKFQIDAVDNIIKYRVCIIDAAIRSGKTLIIAKAIKRIDQYPVYILTKPDKALVRQIQNRLEEYLNRKVGILSEGKFEESDIIVSNYQAVGRALKDYRDHKRKKKVVKKSTHERNKIIKDYVDRAKVLFLDECHRALSKDNQRNLQKFKSVGYKIGVSGTPKPDSMTMVEVESGIGPIVQKVSFDTVIKSGRLAQPVVILYNLPGQWFSNYLLDYEDIYECDIVKNPNRNRFIASVVDNLKNANKNSFIAVSIVEHGRQLRDKIPGSFFLQGKVRTDVREAIYKQLEDKKIYCAIGTVGKEGLDLPKLDAVINAEGYTSSVATIQKMRSLTAEDNKKIGLIIDFMDKEPFYLKKASQKRKQKYEGLKGFIIRHKKVPENFFGSEVRSSYE